MNRWACLVVLVVWGIGSSAMGQTAIERFERQLDMLRQGQDSRFRVDTAVPVGQRVFFDYGGSLSLDFAAIDDTTAHTHILRQFELAAFAHLNVDGVHDFFVRGNATYRWFLSGDDFDGDGGEWSDISLERAYYRFDLRAASAAYGKPAPNFDLSATAGRQLVHWATGLVLSEVLDGVNFNLGFKVVELQALAGVTRRETFDFDPSRPDFDDETFRGFFGALVRLRARPNVRPFAYVLVQQDYNDRSETLLFGPYTAMFEYQSYYVGAGVNGEIGQRWSYSAEFAFEGGEGLSSPIGPALAPIVPTQEDIEAWAGNVRIEYFFNDANRSRISAEVLMASGDSDRGASNSTLAGNFTGTNDESFNGFGLVNTGLAFSPAFSNLLTFRVGASVFPLPDVQRFRRLQVGAEVFVHHKLSASAPIDETTSTQRYLGTETDVYANWEIASDLTLALRYGVFFPGSSILSSDNARHFFFAGLTWGF